MNLKEMDAKSLNLLVREFEVAFQPRPSVVGTSSSAMFLYMK